MALCLDITIDLGGSAYHSDQYWPQQQHGREYRPTWVLDAAQTSVICFAFGGSLGHRYQYRPSFGKTMDPEMAFSGCTVQNIAMAPR